MKNKIFLKIIKKLVLDLSKIEFKFIMKFNKIIKPNLKI